MKAARSEPSRTAPLSVLPAGSFGSETLDEVVSSAGGTFVIFFQLRRLLLLPVSFFGGLSKRPEGLQDEEDGARMEKEKSSASWFIFFWTVPIRQRNAEAVCSVWMDRYICTPYVRYRIQ